MLPADLQPFYLVITGLMGLLFGSFLNVCIFRIPKKESIVTGASHCMTCGKRIPWYDLIPVFSYLILRGRCRGCGAKITIRYPAVEALTAALWLGVYLRYGFTPQTLLYLSLVSALIVAAFIDIDTTEVPLSLTVFILVLGIAALFLRDMPFYERLIGLFAASVPLLIAAVLSKGGMGGGDIKLMAVCGLVIGWKLILLSLLLAVLSGAVYGGVLLILRKKGRKAEIPLVPFLAGSIVVSLLFGGELIAGYLSLIGF